METNRVDSELWIAIDRHKSKAALCLGRARARAKIVHRLAWLERVEIRQGAASVLESYDGVKNYATLLHEHGSVLAIPRYQTTYPQMMGGVWYTLQNSF